MYNKPETFRTFVLLTFIECKNRFFSQIFNECAKNSINNLPDTLPDD